MFGNLPEIHAHVRAGRVRPLAVTGPRRSPGFPDLPTAKEAGIAGYEAVSWGGVIAPVGVPGAIIAKLNAEVNRAISTPLFQERYRAIGNEPVTESPEYFDRFIRTERAKWVRVAKQSGLSID